MQTHIRVLAVLQIVYASIGLLVSLLLLMLFGGAAAIVGFAAPPSDSIIAIPIIAIVATLAAGFFLVLSLPRLIAGIGLLYQRSWARTLTIVVSAIGLLDFPVGTALGIYGLWVMSTAESAALFDPGSPRAI